VPPVRPVYDPPSTETWTGRTARRAAPDPSAHPLTPPLPSVLAAPKRAGSAAGMPRGRCSAPVWFVERRTVVSAKKARPPAAGRPLRRTERVPPLACRGLPCHDRSRPAGGAERRSGRGGVGASGGLERWERSVDRAR